MPIVPSLRAVALLLVGGALASGCGDAESGPPRAPQPASETQALRDEASSAQSTNSDRVILFLGNSLAAGYGLDPDLAFPALIQDRIDSLGLGFQVVNAGLSGETTAGGLRRADWLFAQQIDVLVLELGGNDGLRGIPPESSEANLQAIIDLARKTHPDVEIVLAGMQVPPNLGSMYADRFRRIYTNLADANDLHLIPFLLEGVGGNPALNLPDGIHPTAAGHRIVAETVWDVLGPVLETMTVPAV